LTFVEITSQDEKTGRKMGIESGGEVSDLEAVQVVQERVLWNQSSVRIYENLPLFDSC